MTPILSSAILRTQSDARLLALASRGYDRAFEVIVERYRKPLHRWCRSVLPAARAEDAVQTTFLKAWSALRAGTEVADLKPWLYRIARNAALDNARKAGYDYDELSDSLKLAPAAESELERRTVIRETLTGVAGLPDNQRAALLRTAAGHSRAEIARDLQVTEGSVRQLVHRARTTLRAAVSAITPLPLVSWASALGAEAGAPSGQRIADLAAGVGSAGIAATAVKAGTVIVAAGVLAAGPGSELRKALSKDSSAVGADRLLSQDGAASPGQGAATGAPVVYGQPGGNRAGNVSLGTLAAVVVNTHGDRRGRSDDGSLSSDDSRASGRLGDGSHADDKGGRGHGSGDTASTRRPDDGASHPETPRSGSSGRLSRPVHHETDTPTLPEAAPPPEPFPPPEPSGTGKSSGAAPSAVVPHD